MADLIDAVRAELEMAAINARDQQLQFEVRDVELEVEVETTGTRGVGAGIQIWVLTIGAKGNRANAASHRVTLKLGAVMPNGSKFRVSDVTSTPVRRK